jgi:AcrR family transcriptional regulator
MSSSWYIHPNLIRMNIIVDEMDREVNPQRHKRTYNATRRKQAAAASRHAILAAARDLFLERGYAGATMPAIAEAAGVALDTIYAAIGTKPVLMRQLIESAISGNDEAIPALSRDYVREIHEEPDPRRKLARYARAVREIQERLAPLFSVLRTAAAIEPDLAALWQEIADRRAANMRLFIAEVAEAGGLRDGISQDDAADIVWATNSPEFYLLLVRDRGWDPARFEQWLTDLWQRTLLPDPTSLPPITGS